MSKLKTPHQKKAASLAKDRRPEPPKAARRKVPVEKARLERAHRHALHQTLHVDGAPVAELDVDRIDDAVGGLRREKLPRRPGVPLADHIAERKEARAGRENRRASRRVRATKRA